MPPIILITLDGVRPDALTTARCPTLNSVRENGAGTLQARSVMPSVTLPCHTSIFHSVPPARHGITSNLYVPMARPLPGIVEVARTAGKRIAFFYNWEQLRDLARPGHIHYSYFRDSSRVADGDDETVSQASRFIQKEKPDFGFLYLGTIDTAGHDYGWMSEGYLHQLEHIDTLLGRFFETLPAEYTAILHSDHGGHDRSHGTHLDEDMLIPWMAIGPNIKKGYTIQSEITLLDTAPTIARIMGIPAHDEWEGRSADEIFQ
jgi:predicted AlkP superfamily pyrophosphatase or phosphodiesterase